MIGSPTINNSFLHSVAGFMHLMKELKFKNKKAAVFGCYGWSGEAVKQMNEWLQNAGFAVIDEGIRNQWNPDLNAQNTALEYGKKIALTP